MQLPDRTHATQWDGLDVVDERGERVGPCAAVFADEGSGKVEWLLVDVEGHRRSFVPALGATEVDGTVRLRFARQRVLDAPAVGDDDVLAQADEATLYRHYDVPYDDDASDTVLPKEVAEEGPPAVRAPVPAPVLVETAAPQADAGQQQGGGLAAAAPLAGIAALVAAVWLVLRSRSRR